MTGLKLSTRYIILAAIFVLAFFVSVGVVLAVNDNANEPLCNTWNCDGSSMICSNVQFDWTSNGYPSGAGNKNCCGDDSQEETFICWDSSGAICPANDMACAPSGDRCVYNGQLYCSKGTPKCAYKVNTLDSSGDLEICSNVICEVPSGDCSDNYGWIDQDYVLFGAGGQYITGLCEYTPLKGNCESGAGPGGVCDDYDSNPSNGYCCGDDSSENYITTKCPGATASALCCNSSSDKISSSNTCVSSCAVPCSVEEEPCWNDSECCSGLYCPRVEQPHCCPSGTAWAFAQKSCLSCTDTDGGIDYYEKGNVGGFPETGPLYFTSADGCIDSDTLGEWNCLDSGWEIELLYYDCPYGCENGACRTSPPCTSPGSINNLRETSTGQTSISWDWNDLSGTAS